MIRLVIDIQEDGDLLATKEAVAMLRVVSHRGTQILGRRYDPRGN